MADNVKGLFDGIFAAIWPLLLPILHGGPLLRCLLKKKPGRPGLSPHAVDVVKEVRMGLYLNYPIHP